jgi:hypothetical protein
VISAGSGAGSGSSGNDTSDAELRDLVESYALRRVLQSTFR